MREKEEEYSAWCQKHSSFFSSLHYFLLFLQLPGGGGGAGVTQMVVCVC